jgi:hypothetical protein
MPSYTAQSREAGRAPLPLDTARGFSGAWWLQPVLTVIVLTAFGIYTTWRAFDNRFFCWPWPATGGSAQAVDTAPSLPPFYSPYIPIHLQFGTFAVSPAFYILVFPLAFRMTCYYYRKAYYRAFFWDPPACAITEPMEGMRMRYTGERAFPFILQNLHRFAFYFAAIFIVILTKDAYQAFWFADANGRHFGVGIGSLVLTANVVLLALYTFGCHSWRHLIGGSVDCYSCTGGTKTRYGIWKKVSFLNKRHAFYAWVSMFSVAIADIYVSLVARGVITDLRIL